MSTISFSITRELWWSLWLTSIELFRYNGYPSKRWSLAAGLLQYDWNPTPDMIFFRRHRLITVLFALVSLLFMQLAVASYACPSAVSKIAEAGMPCAQSMRLTMDDAQPSLCQAHCQTGQQSAGTHELPSPVAITALPAAFTLPVTVPVFSRAPLQASHLKRTTAPPVAIRNCCFRI